jgi:hypothetical protein
MFDPDTLPQGPWILETPAPATVILAAVSSAVIESPAAVAQAVANVTGADVDLEVQTDDIGDAPWVAVISIPQLPVPLVCHPEVAPLEGSGLPEPAVSGAGLVIQTLLHPADPLTAFANLLRLATVLDPSSPGVLDADTGRWFDRPVLVDQLLDTDADPREDILWVVTGVHADTGHEVCTSGLSRSGRREIAMTGLDQETVETAADMLGLIAALTLESSLPEAGQCIEIGPGLVLRVTGDADDERTPALLERADGDGPPVDVISALSTGTAAVYSTDRATARQHALTSETWGRFLDLVEPAMAAGGTCYVEVPWECVTGEDDRREHIWMEVVSRCDQHVLASPAHEGELVPELPDEPGRIEAGDVCSWRVILDEEIWTPEHIDLLTRHMAERA